jgi:hypothetical protein
MARVGKRFLARSPYTVQVKSSMDPVVFEGTETVRWLIEHPLPLFLCVVDKASARLSVYHTLPRFYAWSLGRWPDRLEMNPVPAVPGQAGRSPNWGGGYSFSLDQPILDFTINQMQDDAFWENARQVFEGWVELENDNLTRVRMRLLKCRMPMGYRTNEPLKATGGWSEVSLLYPEAEQFDQTASRLKESLEWVGEQLLRRDDLAGATKAALLHRHLFRTDSAILLSHVENDLNKGLKRDSYVFAGVDYLADLLSDALAK